MRQLIITPGGPRVVRTPAPTARPGTVLVQVTASAVSPGTETAGMRGPAGRDATLVQKLAAQSQLGARYFTKAIANPDKAFRRLSQIAASKFVPASGQSDGLSAVGSALGYSAAGVVLDVGAGVEGISIGDHVACAGAGEASHSEFISVRRNLVVKVPEGLALEDAATVTLGAIALQSVRRAEIQLGDRVAVIGLGILGQLAERMVRASGGVTIGLDLVEDRVSLALRNGMTAGASEAAQFLSRVKAATGGQGADVVIVAAASKNPDVVNTAIEAARRKGRVVLLGDVRMDIERPAFYVKELDLLMSTSYGPGRYDFDYESGGGDYPYAYVRWTVNRNMSAYLELLSRGSVTLDGLIDHRISVEGAPALYEQFASADVPPMGAILMYAPDADRAPALDIKNATTSAQSGAKVALVGVGNFGEAVLLPAIRKTGIVHLSAIVGRDPVRTANACRIHKVETALTDVDAAMKDASIAGIVIATRHDQHAGLTARALRAGRHVFVEKPLALTFEELDMVADTLAGVGAARPVLTVGFNRRFSLAALTVKEKLSGRSGPVVITYRVNAGTLPHDHWTQGPEGGGRNIGEACHMYDLCRFFADSAVDAVSAMGIGGGFDARKNENFTATIRYADGSIATLVYTSVGGPEVEKERIEVFCEGAVYTILDFKKVLSSRDGEILTLNTVDKGHNACINAFAKAMTGAGPEPIPVDQLLETTAVALTVEEQL